MAYVLKEPAGFFDRYEIGYYTPTGEWVRHSTSPSRDAGEREVSILNGGDGGASEQLAQQLAAAEDARLRDQQREARRLEKERTQAAAREAENLREQERIQQLAAEDTARSQQEWARLQEENQQQWLAAQEENRRRAEAEAAEQLRKYPPAETHLVGGVASWDGTVLYHFKNGDTLTVATR